ncbi:MAG: S46 family peptidase [Odoribacter sp.]|nr:S46 family peptidase [Odoribacter sp.]
MKKLLFALIALISFSAVRADEGMWLLSLLQKQNINKMQEMGFKLSAEDIYSLNKPGIKDAIVGLGMAGRPFRHFCSAEIVSPQGLLITNHHCAFSMIQEHSSVQHDYLSDGFWAYKMDDELTNPGITASILERMEDVTARINPLLNDNMSEMEREIVIDSISNLIVKETVDGTDFSAQVVPMFEGNQFFLFIYTIYKDVRLVGAPPQSLGKFGGDTDNWMWPRQTCDFAMLRIYTGPDGKPAEYSEDNIPLKPKYHLPVSIKGVEDGDFAMIMGFPGSTDRFATTSSLETTMDISNRIRYEIRTVKLDIMKREMEKSPKTRIQYASKAASTSNYWKYSNEQNKALRQLNTMGNKAEIEAEFTNWVNAKKARKATYGEALNLIKNAYEETREYNEAYSYLTEALAGPETPLFAYRTGRLIENLCEAEAGSEEQEDLKETLQKMGEDFYKDFNPVIDENLYAALYKIYRDSVDSDLYPQIIQMIGEDYQGDYIRFAQDIRNNSIFMNEDKFNAFIQNPDCEKMKEDLAYIAGTSFYSMLFQISAYTQEAKENIAKGNRLFVRGLMEMNPNYAWYPNANSTLRLTYGLVRSYKPRDAVFYDYYTTLTGVMEKECPKGSEFEVPQRLKDLYAAKDFAPYGTGNVVACFISDNDITGGNSGSPVINANGELIGAAFDGNSEAMSGDIDFEKNLQRCINVDMRYVLFVIDKYAGVKNLIDEMTIVK